MLPAPETKALKRAGFTLFEVVIAVFIGVMIMLAAVPSISGLLEEQRAKKLFTQFDDLARQASTRAVTERRPYVLEWDDSGVTMHPLAPREDDDPGATGRVDFGEKLAPDLLLPAALEKDPPPVWTFWPTGTCEPATVTCHVPNATWSATYDPLTEQPVFKSP
jgi:type II secretory pathway pseudopilin PulG